MFSNMMDKQAKQRFCSLSQHFTSYWQQEKYIVLFQEFVKVAYENNLSAFVYFKTQATRLEHL